MINRTLLFVALLLALAIPTAFAAKLPGARPVVDAADYPSLQAAIDAVPRSGGLLRLPPGEFVITQPLLIRHEDLRIEGAGTATHIRNDNVTSQPAIIIRSGEFTDAKKKKVKPLWRVTLANFRLTGNEKSGHGIEAEQVNELLIQGLTVSYHGGDGVHCRFCYEDLRLCDSLITYNKKAGFRATGNHDNVISANQFEENQDAVVYTDGFNLCLTGNNIDDHLRHGVVIENTYGSVVSGNMIEECAGTGVILDRDCYGIAVSSNVIAHEFSGGVDLRDAHGIAVSANAFPIVKRFGVRVGPDSGRSTITGNAFSDSWIGGKPLRTGANKNEANLNEAAGILLEGAADLTITGNSFSGLKTEPLAKIGDCPRLIFSDNSIIASPADSAKKP